VRAFSRRREAPENGTPQIPTTESEPFTDLGAARRLVAAHGQDLRHVWARRECFRWDGRRWRCGAGGDALGLAAACAREWTLASAGEAALVKAARHLESASRIGGAVTLAAVDPRVKIEAAQLDADPMLLTCTNGTIDLRTAEKRPHRREDLLTHLVPHPYDPTATAPRWLQFLDEITATSDADEAAELPKFLQRWFGYCLTGSTREHALLLAIGKGCNGKSVLVETIQHVLGPDLATPAPPGLLLVQKHGERHPTELQDLAGRRLVIANELPKGGTFNDERVKWLAGGDTLKARGMRENFAAFAPTHKLVVCANELPRVRDTSPGFWRRLRVVPFDVAFEGREDRDLSRALRAEAPGILRWLVDGCLAWQRAGLGEPQTVRAATADYRSGEDVVGCWLADCARTERASAAALYGAFKPWAVEHGEYVPTMTAFGKALAAHGWTRDRRDGRAHWTPPGGLLP
jgi:putative DNA primase/helicase